MHEFSSIHQLLEQRAKRDPTVTAIQFGTQNVSYLTLNLQADRVAANLCSRGIGRGDVVALMVERSPELITLIAGILKSGAAYLPIDMESPKQRSRYMLMDSQASLLIHGNLPNKTKHEYKAIVELVEVEDLIDGIVDNPRSELHSHGLKDSEALGSKVTGQDLAYVIYTSGTTGTPKGVRQAHATVSNLVQAQAMSASGKNGLSSNLTTLQFAPFSFDVSIQEIATAWFTGSKTGANDASRKGCA